MPRKLAPLSRDSDRMLRRAPALGYKAKLEYPKYYTYSHYNGPGRNWRRNNFSQRIHSGNWKKHIRPTQRLGFITL
ncbi:hypothetical protein E2I00_005704 [Balaenoptera physalus]|uniref:Uncharacterized protein n=1 Tax=Balaenoptera physalus TaxID=9770 RepID=A0A643C2A2_BALPH|nr:hypothetical protein E2I00_005704 [Balaenoptera physalus]